MDRDAYVALRQRMRGLVFMYQDVQKMRVRAELRQAADRARRTALIEPAGLGWVLEFLEQLENRLERDMGREVAGWELGRWCTAAAGCNAVVAGTLLALVDFRRCCCQTYAGMKQADIPPHDCPGLTTAGKVWAYAGLDQSRPKYARGEKRRHNARLAATMDQFGECLKKLTVARAKENATDADLRAMALEKDPALKGDKLAARVEKMRRLLDGKKAKRDTPAYLYVRLYAEAKRRYEVRNESGGMAKNAAEAVEKAKERSKRGFGKPTAEQLKTWKAGRLTPAHLDKMARNYAVKIFLSHFHQIGRELLGYEKVAPWVIAHQSHTGYIPPPNWPLPGEAEAA